MATKDQKYIEAVGRRKTAIARVRLTPASKTSYTINDKSLADYFKLPSLEVIVTKPLKALAMPEHFAVSVKAKSGGIAAQAEATQLGIARALIKHDPRLKPELKKVDLLTRDAREKERRKFGLKKARKAPQWSKR